MTSCGAASGAEICFYDGTLREARLMQCVRPDVPAMSGMQVGRPTAHVRNAPGAQVDPVPSGAAHLRPVTNADFLPTPGHPGPV